MNKTLAEAKAIHRQGLEIAKRSDWFQKLDRRYRKVDGYEPFSTAAKNLAYNLVAAESGFVGGLLEPQRMLDDFAWSAVISSAWTLAYNPFPVWWLHRNLFEAFEASDLPKAIADLQVSAPFGMIMLPRDRILNPDGEPCDWIFFQHLSQGSVPPTLRFGRHTIQFQPVECEKLRWVTVLRNGTSYASLVEINGDELVRGNFSMGTQCLTDSNQDLTLEQQFQLTLEKIVLQTLLYLQIRPDDLLAPTNAVRISNKGQGFAGKKSDKDRLNPLILGQQFQPQTERISRSAHSTHATPRTHWRRGHWRRVAVGEGRQERKWRWIQPVLVNG
ncbi:hypothetical protein NG796_16720 [Laspinema sp. A4]|uniref:hypothetical protein n=1 Tax=Laspinema sp. D2d TaxID=2953686 RepID=UPI0021BB1EC3|nr:hypothetical protein [Laspinema sp. D2d]MCT7984916.1 hypothetical protein [Laspinema sp. D2d]